MPAAVFEEIRKAVSGYNVQPAGLLTGGAEPTRVDFARNGHAPYDVPVGRIRSAKDTLFTSGTLGRFCTMMESLPEAKTEPRFLSCTLSCRQMLSCLLRSSRSCCCCSSCCR